MIRILVWQKNGDGVKRQLYLPPDFSFTYKIRNPLVNDQGSFSYPIHLDEEQNRHIFGFPGNGNTTEKEFEFEMWVGSDYFLEGDVEIIDADGIEIYLKSGNSSVSSVLRNSYLDQDINGQSWGENSLSFEYSFNATQGFYPDYNFVPFLVRNEDTLFNRQHSTTDRMGRTIAATINSFCPGVYVRYLIDKIINSLGFVKSVDQIADIPDINKLFIWAAKLNPGISEYKSWLPSISALDFLRSIEDKFSVFLYFSPVNRFCEVLKLENVFQLSPRNWDLKFIRHEKSEPYKQRTLLFKHNGSGDEFLFPEKIIPDENYLFNDLSELPDRNYYPVEGVTTLRGILTDRIARVGSEIPYRYFKNSLVDAQNTFPVGEWEMNSEVGLYLQKTLSDGYYIISDGRPESAPIEISNTNTNLNTNNLIAQFVIDLDEGEIKKLLALIIHAKVDSQNSDLVIHFVRQNRNAFNQWQDNIIIAAHNLNINNTSFEPKTTYLKARAPSAIYNILNRTPYRTVLKIYSRATTNRTITIKFGGIDWPNPNSAIASYILIDPHYYEWREIGFMGDLRVGEKTNPDEIIQSSGSVLINDYNHYRGLREIPVTSMKREEIQKDFAFTFYRGLRRELTSPFNFPEPFASPDDVGIDFQEYELEPGFSAAQSTLRWNGEKGIINRFMKNEIFHRKYAWRKVKMKLRLSPVDIAYTPLYHPIMINSQLYIISELSVPIHITKGLQEVTAELLTI